MRKRLKNIGALLLLVLFAGYWSCVTLFPHVHHIDGLLYVHSHPYSGPADNPTFLFGPLRPARRSFAPMRSCPLRAPPCL